MPLANDFRANLVVLCKSFFDYLFCKLKAETEAGIKAGAEIWAVATTKKDKRVLFFLVKTLASLFLPQKKRLQ